jgi:peptidoglycan/LPS O-acetylase OafA/YrhL
MTTRSFSSKEMIFLHGIRALAIIWVVIGHTYGLYYQVPLINDNDILLWTKKISSVFVIAGFMAVDTFFLLSAMLLTLSVFHELDRT